MILWLVRHTKTIVPDGICYGCTDVDLPPGFRGEAAALVEKVKAGEPEVVYSSPLDQWRTSPVLSCLLWQRPLVGALDMRIPLGSMLRIHWDEKGARLLDAHGIDSLLPQWMH